MILIALGVIFFSIASANQNSKVFTQLKIGLHPQSSVHPEPVKIHFGLPVPPDVEINLNDLILIAENRQLPLLIHVLSYWPDTFGKNKIRALLITTELTGFEKMPSQLWLKSVAESKLKAVIDLSVDRKTLPDVSKNWHAVKSSTEYQQPGKLIEPSVYVTLPAQWLSKSLLKTYNKPLLADKKFQWFDQYALNYGNTAVNLNVSKRSKPIDFNRNEPWMYDRVANLYQLYIRSGDVKWLRHAHRAAQFYAHHVNDRGNLEINRMCQLKCSYSQGLWIDYLLTGDKTQIAVIERIEKAGIRWFPRYSRGRAFFTERHQSYAFWALLTAWEAYPSDIKRYKKVLNFFEQTYAGINNPPSGWTAMGCYQHEYRDHEGEGGNQPICSPWMSALLMEAIWKFYLLTDNHRALELLAGFGDYLVQYATYQFQKRQSPHRNSLWLPLYIAGADYKLDKDPSTDIQHSCDIAGALARSVWAKKKLGLNETATYERFEALLESCRKNLSACCRNRQLTNKKTPLWRIAPFRKYNWQFGSTHDMSWLLGSQSDMY